MALLNDVLRTHEADPIVALPTMPDPLPPCHIADARELKDYARQFAISPSHCDVFNRALVYLFYGGMFFRRSRMPTRKAGMYPVGFLFDPAALAQVDWFYPFDTGAFKVGFFGQTGQIVEHWEDCCISGDGDTIVPRLLVRYLFGTNRSYLRGTVSRACMRLPSPLPCLIDHLRREYPTGVDQRQFRIECVSTKPFPLEHLLWVGYPDLFAPRIGEVFERLGVKGPVRYAYHAYRSFSPAEMAAVLQQEAYDFIRSNIDTSI